MNKDAFILCMEALDDTKLRRFAKSGYRHLYGLSTSKKIYDLPFSNKIKYSVSSPLATHFPDSMFDYVYAIRDDPVQIREARRITKDGGTLAIVGPSSTNPRADDSRQIKVRKQKLKSRLHEVNIICPSLDKNDGISQYTRVLQARLKEAGIVAHLFKSEKEVRNKRLKTIIQYEPGLKNALPDSAKGYIIEAHATPSYLLLWIEMKNRIIGLVRDPADILNILYLLAFHSGYVLSVLKRLGNRQELRKLQLQTLLVRSNELARASHLKRYTIMPHIAYPQGSSARAARAMQEELHIGSFGFASESKNFDKICDLASALKIRCTILLSITNLNKHSRSLQLAYSKKLYERYNSDRIQIVTAPGNGVFSYGEMRRRLSSCTHLVSAQNNALGTSGSIRYMISLGKPVISLDNYQAKEAQVYRVKRLSDITVDYLRHTTESISLDDGLQYLLKVLQSS